MKGISEPREKMFNDLKAPLQTLTTVTPMRISKPGDSLTPLVLSSMNLKTGSVI